MPRLIKRKETYAVEYYDPQKGFTTRRTLGTDDAGVAQRLFAEWCLAHLDQKESLETVTVTGLLGSFYAKVAKDYASKYVYKSSLDYCSKLLKDVSLADFRRSRQEQFISALRSEGLKDGTVKRIMAAISTAVTYAYERDQIPSKPHILSVTDDATRDRVLSDDEAVALLEAATDGLSLRYLQVALMTGARPSAIVGLSKGQFDYDHHLLKLLPPGERQIKQKPKPTIALPKHLEDISLLWNDGPLFVVHSDHGKPDRQIASHRTIWSRLEKAVPEDVTAYTIRHTVATELRRQGVPEWDISGYLGHQGPGARTTGRYAHYRPDYMRAAADAMDRYWERLNERRAGVDRKPARTSSANCSTGRRAVELFI